MTLIPKGDGAEPPWANERVFVFRMPPTFFKRNKQHSIFGRSGRGSMWMKNNAPCAGSQSPETCSEVVTDQQGYCLDSTVPCYMSKYMNI